MFKFSEIITRLFPDKSLPELETILDIVVNSAVAFNEASWRGIKRENLSDKETRFRLVRTLFESQDGGEHGIIDIIFDSLEGWSQSHFLFADFAVEDRRFYTSFYALAGCLNFEWFGMDRQLYLLGGPFFHLMVAMEAGLYEHIKKYFSRFCFLSMLQEDQRQFLQAIERNPSRIGPRQSGVTVANFVADYNKFARTNFVGEEIGRAHV